MITDEMLAQAADAYVQIMVDHIPDFPEYSHAFSARFERRMRKIIRRGNHPVLYRTMRVAGYAVAVLVISFMMLMAANPSARAAVMDWIRDVYASFYSHRYYCAREDIDIQDVSCEIGYIPEGYREFRYIENQFNIAYTFKNNTNQLLYFEHSVSPHSIEYFHSLQDYEISYPIINGQNGQYLRSNNADIASILQWTDSETKQLMTVSGFLEESELLKIAENIKISVK